MHRSQFRKGPAEIPYLTHLMAVSGLVLEHGGDEDQAIAALLHDAIEDQDATEAEIAQRFGFRVASIVRACSDTDQLPEAAMARAEAGVSRRPRDVQADALFVSLADKVHNVRTIAVDVDRDGDSYFAVFKGGADGSRWYYRRLADVYQRRAAELPPESVSRPGGKGLLAEYLLALDRIGATREAAAAYEAKG